MRLQIGRQDDSGKPKNSFDSVLLCHPPSPEMDNHTNRNIHELPKESEMKLSKSISLITLFALRLFFALPCFAQSPNPSGESSPQAFSEVRTSENPGSASIDSPKGPFDLSEQTQSNYDLLLNTEKEKAPSRKSVWTWILKQVRAGNPLVISTVLLVIAAVYWTYFLKAKK